METTYTFDMSSFSAPEDSKILEGVVFNALTGTTEKTKCLISKHFFGADDAQELMMSLMDEDERSKVADFFIINTLFYGMDKHNLSTDDVFRHVSMPRKYREAFITARYKQKDIPSNEDLEGMFYME